MGPEGWPRWGKGPKEVLAPFGLESITSNGPLPTRLSVAMAKPVRCSVQLARVEHEYTRGAPGFASRRSTWTAASASPLRGHDRDRPLRPPRRPGHDPAPVPGRPPRLLDSGQPLFASRRPLHPPAPGGLPEPRAGARARSMPAGSTRSRSTSRSCSARRSRPTTSRRSRRSGCASPASRSTTRASPSPSPGASPVPILRSC